ncbi:MAG: hypothetical protein INR71_03815, partial [Terriglobus roseus]|nr:hypothetical protein [Terriglobus roseus]
MYPVSADHLDILNLTSEEKRFYKQVFSQADSDGSGVITGEVAVKFLEKTNVPSQALGEIWQIADRENRGFLTPSGFAVCLRLIGHFQNGRDPDANLAFQAGPLPKFEGIAAPLPPPPQAAQTTGLQPQLSGTGPIRVPPLSPEKATDYAGLFERSGAQDGIMSGDKAKDIFEKARLPNEILGRIWNLSDTEQRGALSVTEFIIAMHLLAAYRSRTMTGIPATLPAGLWEAAARRVQPGQAVPTGAPPGPVPRQFSGAGGPLRTASPVTRSQYGTPSPTQQSNWVVTPQEKQQFDMLFNNVDTKRSGFITGEQAVAFFSESGLNEDHLATIWDLSDINSEGRLSRDEFALAMYLIRLQRGKQQSVLPTTLPPNFIPPSMRNQARPPSQSTAPAFDNAAAAANAPRSASEDLFGLDALTSPPPAQQPQVPQSTGGSAAPTKPVADPFGSQPSSPRAAQPQSTGFQSSPATGSFKPFVPSSTFGRGLQHQNTGGSMGSTASGGRAPQPPSAMDDLLGDNDPEVSKKLTSETAELANMSNQIGTLRTQMQEVQQKKTTTENDLSRTSTQKRDLELRLSQFRQQYENEIRAVKELEQKLSASKADTEKLKRDYATVESSFQDLQGQHQQVAQALAADQQE